MLARGLLAACVLSASGCSRAPSEPTPTDVAAGIAVSTSAVVMATSRDVVVGDLQDDNQLVRGIVRVPTDRGSIDGDRAMFVRLARRCHHANVDAPVQCASRSELAAESLRYFLQFESETRAPCGFVARSNSEWILVLWRNDAEREEYLQRFTNPASEVTTESEFALRGLFFPTNAPIEQFPSLRRN